jgi:hypothetical protein
MTLRPYRTIGSTGAVVVLVCALLITRPANAGVEAPLRPDPSVVDQYDQLEAYVSSLPPDVLPGAARKALLRYLKHSESAYARDQLCSAVRWLEEYLTTTQGLRTGTFRSAAEDLFNRGWMVRRLVVSTPGRSPCSDPEALSEPGVTVDASDITHVSGTISVHSPALVTVTAGGQAWTDVQAPGVPGTVGQVGAPAVPMIRRIIAVPHGARVSVDSSAVVARTISMSLYPLQPEPDLASEQDFLQSEPPPASAYSNKPFTEDAPAYATDAPYPSSPCDVTPLGSARDLPVALLECAVAQYNPVSEELDLTNLVQFDVTFSGGDRYFVTDDAFSPFESAAGVNPGNVLNGDAVARYTIPSFRLPRCLGEEFLILTPPDFLAAADELRQWKQDEGLMTVVAQVGDGAGPGPDTAPDIHTFLENQSGCLVRPSYVLLFGDAEFIPTFLDYKPKTPPEPFHTDFPYSVSPYWAGDIYVGDLVPDFALGRIPVDDASQAQAAVERIMAYEGSPPADPAFYQQATIASHFQCCRTDGFPNGTEDGRSFIQTAESMRNWLLSEGKDVQRVYVETVEQGDATANPPIPAYTGDPTPRRYSDGVTPLPADLAPGSGFDWHTGDPQTQTPAVQAAWNAGRFLMIHVDHGFRYGWVNPHLWTGDLGGHVSPGGDLPVVFSINCSSGAFATELDNLADSAPSFAEFVTAQVDPYAIAAYASTAITNPSETPIFAGMLDAVWPDILPVFGPTSPERRLGDMLNHGRAWEMQLYGAGAPTYFGSELYHLFGDPTVAMWRTQPVFLPTTFQLVQNADGLNVSYDVDGATITAYQDTTEGPYPVGRAQVVDGVARIPYFQQPLRDLPIVLSASAPDSVSSLLASGRTPRQRGGRTPPTGGDPGHASPFDPLLAARP